MRTIIYLTIITIILFFTGCATSTSTIITQKDETSYLKLIGDMDNLTMQIDDGVIIVIDPEKENVVYQVNPGTHIVTIYRNKEMIVKRKLFFDDNITKEIEVK